LVDFLNVRSFADADVLSRMEYSKLFDNDGYFHGIADGWNTVPNGVERRYIADEEQVVVWDGWHILQADAKSLYYGIVLANDDPSHPSTITLYYDYGGAGQLTIATRSTNGISSGYYDLAAKSAPNFFRVTCLMTRAGGDTGYDALGACIAPYTIYTGSKSFATPPTITDGLLSAAATQFNVWRANQLYLYDLLSPQLPFNSCSRGYTGSETWLRIWDGWIRHKFRRLRYRVWLRENAGGNTLTCYYDWGGANQYTILQTTSEDEQESYVDLPDVYTPGTHYRVTAIISRTDTGVNTDARIRYFMESPIAATAGYTALGELAAAQYVFGNTAGQTTRAALLSANQTNLNGRLAGTRRDYAVRKASYQETGETGGTWMYWMQHRYPHLYYRGQNLVLKWGTANDYQTLTDTDDAENMVLLFDLRQLTGLIRGIHYHIEGTPEFALEMKETF
jgi:hypothetical protein